MVPVAHKRLNLLSDTLKNLMHCFVFCTSKLKSLSWHYDNQSMAESSILSSHIAVVTTGLISLPPHLLPASFPSPSPSILIQIISWLSLAALVKNGDDENPENQVVFSPLSLMVWQKQSPKQSSWMKDLHYAPQYIRLGKYCQPDRQKQNTFSGKKN